MGAEMTGARAEPTPRCHGWLVQPCLAFAALTARLGKPTVARRIALLAFYAVLACVVLWPYRGRDFRGAGDLTAFIAGTVEARNALREGQFPIRVAPHQLDRARYPLFQYYANFPYTVTGALHRAGLDPYAAWKLAMLAAFTAGGVFVHLSAHRITRSRITPLAAGASFVLAPYVFTDLNARGAIAELFAMNLLPVAFYATLRCLASRRRRYVVASAAAWTAVGLSHNITYLFGVILLGLFFTSMLDLRPRSRSRAMRLVAAGLLHTGLMLWYVVPQLKTLSLLEMSARSFSPAGPGALSTWDVLLAPILDSPADSTTPKLGLQIGWPVLGGVLLAVVGLVVARGRRFRPLRRHVMRLLALFAVAAIVAWSPLDFWDRVPRFFWFIQFPYRMLVFTTLLGAMLAACGISLCFRGRRVSVAVVAIFLAFVGASVVSYVPRAGLTFPNLIQEELANPVCGGLSDYILSDAASARTALHAEPSQRFVSLDEIRPRYRPGRRARVRFETSEAVLLQTPVLFYPGMMRVTDNGRSIPYGNIGRFVAVELAAGAHVIEVRYVGARWANWASGTVVVLVLVAGIGSAIRGQRQRRRKASTAHTPGQSEAVLRGAPPRIPGEQNPRSENPGRRGVWASGARFLLALVAVFGGGATAWAIRAAVERAAPEMPRVISASRELPNAVAANAFDGRADTAWIVNGPEPASVTLTDSRAHTLRGLRLHARRTGLFEAWQVVRVVCSTHGWPSLDRTFELKNAARDGIIDVTFAEPVSADRIQLEFVYPVLETPDGRRLRPDQVNPGYTEIEILPADRGGG
jgi:hypothetical protein